MRKLNYTAIKVIAFVPTILLMMTGIPMPVDAQTIENNYINLSTTKQTETLLLAKGGQHTKNKTEANRKKHENGERAKKKQEENKKFLEAKDKNSRTSKDALRTNGSKKRR